jgi:hypothetical protein
MSAQGVSLRPLFPPAYPYLLRLEKREIYTNTCVLLKKDGSYHYERIHGLDHVTVLEGELSPDALGKVSSLLERPDLAKLKQDDILEPLMPLGDEVQVNVFRRDHWQDLIFSDSRDRKHVVPTVDSLLDWLNALPKLPHRELTEFEGRNNCLTERKIELQSRPFPPPIALPPDIHASEPGLVEKGLRDPGMEAPPEFLLRMTVDRVGDPRQRRCAIVYPDGKYHTEKTTQGTGEVMHSQVSESDVAPSELENLRRILNAPEWGVEYHEQPPPGIFIRAGEFVHLQIPGANGIEKSVFANLDFTPISGADSHMETDDIAAIPGSHGKLLAPLRAWFKKNVEDAKLPVLKDVPASNCKPRS